MTQNISDLLRPCDEQLINKVSATKEVVTNIRAIRTQKNISPPTPLHLQIVGDAPVKGMESILAKMAELTSIDYVATADSTAASFRVGTTEYAVPLGSLIDKDAEIAKLQEELTYLEGFLKKVEAKLSNPSFVGKAPEKIIEAEKKKQSDANEKIAMLKENIKKLSN
jgi:valyl-tRNA synthetase